MGTVVPIRGGEKREPLSTGVDPRAALVARVEERLRASNPRLAGAQWKLRKDDDRERRDLVLLARNLHTMLAELRHGRKGAALARAGFGGGNQSVYVENLTVPPSLDPVPPRRMARLTPLVTRYLDVALAVEPDRRRAIAMLFDGTSLDRTLSQSGWDWADRLAGRLADVTARIAASTGLPALFDKMSDANVCLIGQGEFEPRLSDWLSETFHKFDFAAGRTQPERGFWLYDRSEEGTPVCGAPLFCPRVALDRREEELVFLPADRSTPTEAGSPEKVVIRFRVDLHVTLVPLAESLERPCRVACWLVQRPTAWLVQPDQGELYGIDDRQGDISIRGSAGVWTMIQHAGPSLADDADLRGLFVRDGEGESVDLTSDRWWCRPAMGEVIRAFLVGPHEERLLPGPDNRRLDPRIWDEGGDVSRIDHHAFDPEVFAPWGSKAALVQEGLVSGALEAALRKQVDVIAGAIRDLKSRLRASHEGI